MVRRWLPLTLAGLVIAVAGCSGGFGESDSVAEPDEGALSGVDEALGDPQVDGDVDFEEGPAADDAVAQAPAEDEGESRPLPVAQPPRSGDRVIKEGRVTLEIEPGSYQGAFDRVVSTARGLGGSVVETRASSTDDLMTGAVTVRVPVHRYEELLSGLEGIGTLREQNITSSDVTAEFVDLEARLRHLRAQEAFYLDLLDEASGIEEAIIVQGHLESFQERIEQVQGRLGVLRDRTDFSTLTVELMEVDDDRVVASADAGPRLADYWETGWAALVTVVGWGIVMLVSLAPVWLLALAVLLIWWLARRQVRPAG